MANPTISVSLNKAAYVPGETMTATVTYGDPDTQRNTLTFTGTDSDGQTAQGMVSYVIDPTVLSYVDSSGKTWTKVSDSGSVAVFTATA